MNTPSNTATTKYFAPVSSVSSVPFVSLVGAFEVPVYIPAGDKSSPLYWACRTQPITPATIKSNPVTSIIVWSFEVVWGGVLSFGRRPALRLPASMSSHDVAVVSTSILVSILKLIIDWCRFYLIYKIYKI
jgi:hypothetical protein